MSRVTSAQRLLLLQVAYHVEWLNVVDGASMRQSWLNLMEGLMPKFNRGQSVSAAAQDRKKELAAQRERWVRDKDMIENPDRWPNWPRLTLKPRPRDGVSPDWDAPGAFGIILDSRPLSNNDPLFPPYRVHWTEFREGVTPEHRDYDTIEALLEVYTVD